MRKKEVKKVFIDKEIGENYTYCKKCSELIPERSIFSYHRVCLRCAEKSDFRGNLDNTDISRETALEAISNDVRISRNTFKSDIQIYNSDREYAELYVHQTPLSFVDAADERNFTKKTKAKSEIAQTLESHLRSVSRRKKEIRRLVTANSSSQSPDTFLTLTFSDKFLPSDEFGARKAIGLFLKRLNYVRDFARYIWILHRGTKQKRLHFHIIFFNVTYVHFGILEKIWGLGSIKVNKIKSSVDAARYVAKYVSKSQDNLKGKQYSCSAACRDYLREFHHSRFFSLSEFLGNWEVVFQTDYLNVFTETKIIYLYLKRKGSG